MWHALVSAQAANWWWLIQGRQPTLPPDQAPMLRVAARLLADTALVAGALFVSAGTLAWTRAWVLLAVLLLIRAIGAYAVHRVSPSCGSVRLQLEERFLERGLPGYAAYAGGYATG